MKRLAQVDKKVPETEMKGARDGDRKAWKWLKKAEDKLQTSVGWDGNPMLGKDMSGENFRQLQQG